MLSALLLLLATGQTVAAPPERGRLDCGLQLTVIEDHTLPLVSVQLWYRAGSVLDDPARPGLCHVARTVVEHRGQAALRPRAAGVRFEGLTLPDACCFASVLPPELLEHVLTIEADRMRAQPIEPSELSAAIQAAARRETLDLLAEPRAVYQQLRAGAFRGHPYGHAPEHVAAGLVDLAPPEIDAFIQRWFVPSNAVLVVVGDVRPTDVQALVKRLFEPLEWTEPTRAEEPPAIDSGSEALAATSGDVSGLHLAWALPRLEAVERVALDVLMQRLGNPVDGPVAKLLRDLGAVDPRWRGEHWRGGGLLTLSADRWGPKWDGARLASAIEGVRDELARAAREPADEIALNRARALASRRITLRRATFAARALELGHCEVVGGDALLADFERAAAERATVGDLQQAATQLLEARMVWLSVGAATSQAATAPAGLPPPLVGSAARPLDAPAALELLRQAAPDVPAPQAPRPPGALSEETLDNGVRITVLRIPGAEPTTVRTLIDAQHSLATSAAALPAVGSAKRDVGAYRDYLSYHGLDLFALVQPRTGLHSRGPARKVAQMIELHADMIRHPDLSDAARDAAFAHIHQANQTPDGWPPRYPPDEYYLAAGTTGWRMDMMLRPRGPAEVGAYVQSLKFVSDVEVLVVGDSAAADVTAAVRNVWRDWQPHASRPLPISAPASRPATLSEPTTAIGWAKCSWCTETLLIVDELSPASVEPSLRHFGRQWIGWTLAGPLRRATELDAARGWRWHWFFVEDDWMAFRAFPAHEPDLGDPVQAFVERMRKLRRGELPAAEAATALRQARVDRLLALDSTDAIADLLQRGIRSPWNLHAELGPADLARLAREIYDVELRTIGGEGPTDREPELVRFRSVYRRTERSPGE